MPGSETHRGTIPGANFSALIGLGWCLGKRSWLFWSANFLLESMPNFTSLSTSLQWQLISLSLLLMLSDSRVARGLYFVSRDCYWSNYGLGASHCVIFHAASYQNSPSLLLTYCILWAVMKKSEAHKLSESSSDQAQVMLVSHHLRVLLKPVWTSLHSSSQLKFLAYQLLILKALQFCFVWKIYQVSSIGSVCLFYFTD